jgi:hypothetical protein
MKTLMKTAAVISLLSAAPVSAATIVVSLGPSAQNFTLYGIGPLASNPARGTFNLGQGSSVFNAATNTSTFTLTGAITGGTAGYNSGTYSFVTTYAGLNTPQAGPNGPSAVTTVADPNFFNYLFISPTTTMTLNLFLPSGTVSQQMFAADNFVPGTNFSFLYSGATTCTGLGALPCNMLNTGRTPGSTMSGPVTISASFTVPDAPVPEPATWATMLAGFGLMGAAMRRKQSQALRVRYA